MASVKLTIGTTLQRVDLKGASVVVIKNDGVSNLFYDFDLDPTISGAELQSGESITFDLAAANTGVLFASFLSASSSTVRVWWV